MKQPVTSFAPSEKLELIRRMVAAGFVLTPVCSPTEPHEHRYGGKSKPCKPRSMGKVPPRFDWGRTRHGQYAPEFLAPGNYGVVLQPRDLVIDIDPRNFKMDDKPFRRLMGVVGTIASFTVHSGSGGYHVYLRKPETWDIIDSLEEYPGIDFLSSGKQVVGPGSLHGLTKSYYVVHHGSPDQVADAPQALLDLIHTSKREPAAQTVGRFVDDLQTRTRFADYLREAPLSIKGEHGDETAFKVAAHGRDLGLPPAVTLDLMLEFWNPRCTPNWVAENLQVKVENAYRYGKSALGAEHPADDFAPAPEVTLANAPVVSWAYNKNGGVVRCFRNTLNYFFDHTSGIKGIFAFNEFSARYEFVQPAPWHRGRLPITRAIVDHDLHMLKGFMASRHRYEVSVDEIASAIANAADAQRFHPVREYLAGLKWDGIKRLDTWLKKYLGAREEPGAPDYLPAVGRKTLCAAVMRVLQPGCPFDHVLVLEGAQDVGKSSVVRILGGDYASDAPVDPHSRDTVDALQGRWIVEMAELEVFRKADEDALKAFITRPTDRVRLAYGRMTGEYPRQCIFIATKNPRADSTYLKDDTGNRRWWPVFCAPAYDKSTKLPQVDFDGLRAVRDQLFAEAVYLMTQEKPREPLSMHTPELKAQARAVVAKRLARHDWTEAVADWLMRQQARPETRMTFVTSRDVFRQAMQGTDLDFGRSAALAIAGIMRDLGWEQSYGRQEGVLHRGWRLPEVEEPAAPPPAPPAPVIIKAAPKRDWKGLL